MGSLAFVGLLPLLTQTAPALDDLVRACEHVEIGRIESLRPIEGLEGLRIATLRVEESIWTADCADAFDFLVTDDSSATQGIRVGDLAVWFLADSGFQSDPFDSATRKELYRIRPERLTGRLSLERKDDQTRVVLPWSESAIPEDLRASARPRPHGDPGQSIPSGPFEIWVWREIFKDTPRIRCRTDGLVIGPDGHGSITNRETEGLVLVPSALRSILGTIDRENFYSMPRKIGNSPGPDSAGWELEVRTWRGHHIVLVAGPPDKRSTADVDAYARIMRIRSVLPRSMRTPSRRD
jgi:hypothetical protein